MSRDESEPVYGTCDACGSILRGTIPRVAVRRLPDGEWKFGFCSGECRATFFDRDDIAERPATYPDQ